MKAAPVSSIAPTSVMLDLADHIALTQQVYFEARCLDEERYQDWLALLTEDVRYRMPLEARRFRKDRSEPLSIGEGFTFDENLGRLGLRIKRLESGLVWAEDPRNHVRRAVTNVEIWQTETKDEADVRSVVTLHRGRIDGDDRRIVAGRKDVWRRADATWKLARRDIELDHTIVPDTNLNTFF